MMTDLTKVTGAKQHADDEKLKAVFVGSLSNGFDLKAAVNQDAAEKLVAELLADGRQFAEAIEVQNPESLDNNFQPDPSGDHFTVFSNGVGGEGASVFGPFSNFEVADQFGVNNRHGDQWEVFEQEHPTPLPIPLA